MFPYALPTRFQFTLNQENESQMTCRLIPAVIEEGLLYPIKIHVNSY